MANEKGSMRILVIAIALLGPSLAQAAAPTRVPPPGIAIAGKDRAELRAGADALAREIDSLRSSKHAALLPDVEIFHKAADWALRYDEFYRSNEVGAARALLRQGLERARQLREGKPGWLTATGLVVRGYVSKIDGSVQPYGLVVPATFAAEPNKPRRLDVWLHGRDDRLTELKFISDRQRSYGEFTPADSFVLHPYGRYCNAFKFAGEVDVFEAMDAVKKSYSIDERRIGLRGFSMGGAGAWHLAAHHPGVWAVAAPGAGFAETAEYQKLGPNRSKFPSWEQKLWQLYDATDYAANFFNLPVVAYNGTEDPQRQAADVMERAMRAEGLQLPRVWGTNVGHKYTPAGKKEVSAFVDDVVARGKDMYPATVHFTTRTVAYNSSGGVRIRRLEHEWERADIILRAQPNSWVIDVTNVLMFDVDRPGPVPMRISVNGQQLSRSERSQRVAFIKVNPGQWRIDYTDPLEIMKEFGLQGPIDDAFNDKFLFVRPTGETPNAEIARWTAQQMTKAASDWRAQFRGDVPSKDDTEIKDEDLGQNLVLWGDPQSNRLLARISRRLPIQWTSDSVKVGAKTFSAKNHVPILIFPNPLSSGHYIVLNSGFTFAAAGFGSNAQQTPKLPDYAIVDVEHGGAVVLADFFDEQWRLR